MGRLITSRLLVAVAATWAFALLAGWSVHRDSPQGLLRETAAGCLSVSHGFAEVYVAVLGVAGMLAVVLAIALWLIAQLGLFAPRRAGLRAWAASATAFALLVGAAVLLRGPLMSAMPLAAPPERACVALAQRAALPAASSSPVRVAGGAVAPRAA